jgi:hypothetical protein
VSTPLALLPCDPGAVRSRSYLNRHLTLELINGDSSAIRVWACRSTGIDSADMFVSIVFSSAERARLAINRHSSGRLRIGAGSSAFLAVVSHFGTCRVRKARRAAGL